MRFPGTMVATVTCGTPVAMNQALRIWGAARSIRVPNPWKTAAGPNQILVQPQGETEPQVTVVEGGAPLYTIEADTVARHIGKRQAPSPCMTWPENLGTMAALDAWRRSVGLVFDVERG